MQKAQVGGKPIVAGSKSPDMAQCPVCGGVVCKRKRRLMDGSVIYYYRHQRGVGEDCSKRYHPA